MQKSRFGYERIRKQIDWLKQQIEKKEINSVEILSINKNLKNITLSFSGPLDSPYEGYWFRIRIQWPFDYPLVPPKCILLDPIWNPFIDFQKRQICMDILEEQFSPVHTVVHYVLSIISLLSQTKISHIKQGFMNPDAAIQMMKNYPLFFKHAKQCSQVSSYKKQQIYTDEMRGLQQKHQIQAQQEEIVQMKTQNQISKKFNKNSEQIKRRKQIRKRQIRKKISDLRKRREKYKQLKIKYGLGSQINQAQIEKQMKQNPQQNEDEQDQEKDKN